MTLVLDRFIDSAGVERVSPARTVHILREMIEREDTETPRPAIAIAGARMFSFDLPPGFSGKLSGSILLEDGGKLVLRPARTDGSGRLNFKTSKPIPLGVHRLLLSEGGQDVNTFMLARPRSLRRTVAAFGRRLALFLPLYAMRNDGPFGVGTYRDLREFAAWANKFSGAVAGTLPLFPTFLDKPFDPCPYAPVSRLMWNELFIDPRDAPEWKAPSVQKLVRSEAYRQQAVCARAGRFVDYRLSWRLARQVLKAMAAEAKRDSRHWSRVVLPVSENTKAYAHFRARTDATGGGWDRWSVSQRHEAEDASVDPADVDLYLYAQSLAASQMTAVRRSDRGASPLYLDLPIGVHAHGFDTYAWPDLFLHGVSAGAPPDDLNRNGQVWGFPPMHPTAGRVDGYAYFRTMLRQMFSVAGVLRIDHVMGLYRMYCVPAGEDGSNGAYLRYPEEELFSVLLIEAARAMAVVVGEDLGTVPPEVRAIMNESGILGMHVQQFSFGSEEEGVVRPAGANVLASLNTHDTPTFAGFWHGDDIVLRQRLNHLDAEAAASEIKGRRGFQAVLKQALMRRHMLAKTASDAAFSLMREQSRGPAPITLVNLEDLWGERAPQNVPGTSTEYPNWRRRGSKRLKTIMNDPAINRKLKQLAHVRQASTRNK